MENLEPSDSLLSFYMTSLTFNHPSGILDESLAKKKIILNEILVVENLLCDILVKSILGENVMQGHVIDKQTQYALTNISEVYFKLDNRFFNQN